MEVEETRNLGGIERPKDERDFPLGAAQLPVQRPAQYVPDMSWLKRNYQGKTPTCGAHALAHLKAILDHTDSNAPRYTPRYSWIKIKSIDGFPLDSGTDMRSIFKATQANGADDFEPLEDDVTLPLPTYSEASAITAAMDANAAQKKIGSYAFGSTDFDSLCQYIFQNRAVLLLIKCDDGLWGTKTPTFTTAKYGHFLVGCGYDGNGIYVVDSADPDDSLAFKYIDKKYITPEFFFESGTAVDIPQSVQQVLQHPQIPQEQKVSIAKQILNDIAIALSLIQKELKVGT